MEQSENTYPEPRWLDSVFIRVSRSGKICNRCFTDLNEAEQKAYLATLDHDGVEQLCMLMAGAVRGIGDLFGLTFAGSEEI